MLDVLSKYREMSSMFKKEVMECKRELFICKIHYAEDDIEYTKTDIKTPRFTRPPNNEFALRISRILSQQRQMMLKERKQLCTKILMSCIKECRSVIGLQRKGTPHENNAVKLTFVKS